MMSRGQSVITFFPAVTNCLSSSSLAVRSLVATYILRQARLEPDLALLSVNTFQKDLGDPNPALRALAIRVLAGLELHSISGLVILSLKRCARDSAWYVRRTVAVACAQLCAQDSAQIDSITPIITGFLSDKSALVQGAAAAVFAEIFILPIDPGQAKNRVPWDSVHPHYRHLCNSLIDADEWGQVALLELLMIYARLHFLNPDSVQDPDLNLLLKSAIHLLSSPNPAVVIMACRLLTHCGTLAMRPQIVRPLLRIFHASPELQYVVLVNLGVLAENSPVSYSVGVKFSSYEWLVETGTFTPICTPVFH